MVAQLIPLNLVLTSDVFMAEIEVYFLLSSFSNTTPRLVHRAMLTPGALQSDIWFNLNEADSTVEELLLLNDKEEWFTHATSGVWLHPMLQIALD